MKVYGFVTEPPKSWNLPCDMVRVIVGSRTQSAALRALRRCGINYSSYAFRQSVLLIDDEVEIGVAAYYPETVFYSTMLEADPDPEHYINAPVNQDDPLSWVPPVPAASESEQQPPQEEDDYWTPPETPNRLFTLTYEGEMLVEHGTWETLMEILLSRGPSRSVEIKEYDKRDRCPGCGELIGWVYPSWRHLDASAWCMVPATLSPGE